MNKTYMWSLIAAVAVVLIGIGVSLMYTSPNPVGTTTDTLDTGTTTASSTVTIGDKTNTADTILTPSTRFLPAGTSSMDIPHIDFALLSPKAGDRFTTGKEVELSVRLADPKQELLVLGFELYDAGTKKFVQNNGLPSIQSNSGSLNPTVMWTIPKTVPAGTYYVVAYVNRTPTGVESPAFEITKNPVSIIASANNQFETVAVRERGESVELEWRTEGATSCTVGLTSDLQRGQPANGRKTVFVKPGDSLIASCEAGSNSAQERIRVVKK